MDSILLAVSNYNKFKYGDLRMNPIIKIFLAALIITISTGCTSYFKRSASTVTDKDGKPIGTTNE